MTGHWTLLRSNWPQSPPQQTPQSLENLEGALFSISGTCREMWLGRASDDVRREYSDNYLAAFLRRTWRQKCTPVLDGYGFDDAKSPELVIGVAWAS